MYIRRITTSRGFRNNLADNSLTSRGLRGILADNSFPIATQVLKPYIRNPREVFLNSENWDYSSQEIFFSRIFSPGLFYPQIQNIPNT